MGPSKVSERLLVVRFEGIPVRRGRFAYFRPSQRQPTAVALFVKDERGCWICRTASPRLRDWVGLPASEVKNRLAWNGWAHEWARRYDV